MHQQITTENSNDRFSGLYQLQADVRNVCVCARIDRNLFSEQEGRVKEKYEYKFIRLDQDKREQGYQDVILEHAKDGWHLIQVFATGAGGLWGKANFCEVILERQIED